MEGISGLPDEVLQHILSFVPLKEAVSLSIVSKRWSKMIHSLPCLCFNDGFQSKRIKKSDSRGFMNFVDRVLHKRNVNVGVDKLSIKCGGYVDSERLLGWILHAISKSVRELDLELDLKEFTNFHWLPLVFTCKTLEVLRVQINTNANFFCKVPAKNRLPNLRTLYLSGLKLSVRSIERLMSGCAKLEELELNHCKLGKKYCSFSVINPTLKRLNIGYMGGTYPEYKIHIDAPSLVYFKCLYLPEGFSGKNLNSLVEAHINFGKSSSFYGTIQGYSSATINLFEAISNVKSLHLSGFFEEVFTSSGSIMPKLHKLTYLMLDGQIFNEGKRLVSVLPQCFPNIEALDFKVKHTFENKQQITFPEIPCCCWTKLKKLNILSFGNTANELRMIEYLLNSAQSLEKLIVRTMERSRKPRPAADRRSITRKKLSKLTNRSNCEIIVM